MHCASEQVQYSRELNLLFMAIQNTYQQFQLEQGVHTRVFSL